MSLLHPFQYMSLAFFSFLFLGQKKPINSQSLGSNACIHFFLETSFSNATIKSNWPLLLTSSAHNPPAPAWLISWNTIFRSWTKVNSLYPISWKIKSNSSVKCQGMITLFQTDIRKMLMIHKIRHQRHLSNVHSLVSYYWQT